MISCKENILIEILQTAYLWTQACKAGQMHRYLTKVCFSTCKSLWMQMNPVLAKLAYLLNQKLGLYFASFDYIKIWSDDK